MVSIRRGHGSEIACPEDRASLERHRRSAQENAWRAHVVGLDAEVVMRIVVQGLGPYWRGIVIARLPGLVACTCFAPLCSPLAHRAETPRSWLTLASPAAVPFATWRYLIDVD